MTKAIRHAAAALLATAAVALATPADAGVGEWGSAEWLATQLYLAANGYSATGFTALTPTCNDLSSPDFVVVMRWGWGGYVVGCGR